MSTRRRLGIVLTAIGLLFMLWGAAAAPDQDASRGSTSRVAFRLSADAETTNGKFGVAGERDGLYPGATSPMALRITNPNPFAIQIDEVSATKTSDKTGCSAENLSFGQIPPGVIVPADSTASAEIPVSLVSSAGDSCQGATFRLAFSGRATPAPGVSTPDPTTTPTVLGATLQHPGGVARTGIDAPIAVGTGSVFLLAGLALTLAGRDARRRGAES